MWLFLTFRFLLWLFLWLFDFFLKISALFGHFEPYLEIFSNKIIGFRWSFQETIVSWLLGKIISIISIYNFLIFGRPNTSDLPPPQRPVLSCFYNPPPSPVSAGRPIWMPPWITQKICQSFFLTRIHKKLKSKKNVLRHEHCRTNVSHRKTQVTTISLKFHSNLNSLCILSTISKVMNVKKKFDPFLREIQNCLTPFQPY